MPDRKKDTFQIRNSTVDFLVFTRDAHEDGIEVRVQDQDVWLTQKAIAQLFEVDRSVVTKQLKKDYESGELSEAATSAQFAQIEDNGISLLQMQIGPLSWMPFCNSTMQRFCGIRARSQLRSQKLLRKVNLNNTVCSKTGCIKVTLIA